MLPAMSGPKPTESASAPAGSASPPQPGYRFTELVEVMRRLLAPGGCPWDREQTLASLRPYLVEETYEVLDAMDRGDPAEHCEELGDLLMQVVFHAALREAEGAFDVDDVSGGIVDKLVRRHPHVFADASAETSEQVLAQWDQIKDQEKAGAGKPRRTLDGVPLALPPLARATKLSKRASKVGFDWPGVEGSRAKVLEELAELDEAAAAGDEVATAAEVGDLLFAVVNLARKHGVDPDMALRDTNGRFEDRFRWIEDSLAAEGRTPGECTLEELDDRWNRAKSAGVGVIPPVQK